MNTHARNMRPARDEIVATMPFETFSLLLPDVSFASRLSNVCNTLEFPFPLRNQKGGLGGEVCMFAGGGLFTQSNMSASRGQFDTLINADIVAPASSNTPKFSRAHASMLKSGDLTSYPAS